MAHEEVTGDDSDSMATLFSPRGAGMRALPQYAAFVEAEGLTKLWAKHGTPDQR